MSATHQTSHGAKVPPPRRGRGKSAHNLAMIQAAYEIARECAPISVRGIAYKLFTMGHIASMGKRDTAKVSVQLTDARERGIIPWEWIVDEPRGAERVALWANPDQIIDQAVNDYRRDYWREQPCWVEVWSEKGTVRGVLRPILDKYGTTFRVMHGYTSATAIHDIAAETAAADRRLTVLYVGDWDPSGLNMSEIDLPGRIARYNGQAALHRIALREGDTKGLPSFAAVDKAADSRYRWFVEQYGDRCWELDAMDPNDLRARVEWAILALIDRPAWDHAIEIEKAEVASMKEFYASWQASISGLGRKYSGMEVAQ